MVVPVLIASCQVSLNPKSGPDSAHRMMIATAATHATGCPAACAVHFENR